MVGGQANLDMTSAGDKKKRMIKNPQPKLNPERLMGPRGIQTIEDLFENWESKGKGKEFEDLDVIMTKLEHWAHRLYPKLPFDNVVDVVANRLGKKKAVQTHLKKIRLGMVTAPVHVGGDGVESEEEREVSRYGEGDKEPDVFQELLRRAGGGEEDLPPVRTQPPAANPGLTEEQRERMRKMKEVAAGRKRHRAEQERKEAEEELRRVEMERQFDEETAVEREIMAGGEAALTSTKNLIEEAENTKDESRNKKQPDPEHLDLDEMMEHLDED